MAKNKNIIRVGDQVRILRAERFVRCGYPKRLADYYDAALKIWNQIPDFQGFSKKARSECMKSIAFGLAESDGFGGPVRSIYKQPSSAWKVGEIFTVFEVRWVTTGRRWPASGGYNSYTGENDYDPPFLDNAKRVKILSTGILGESFVADDVEKVYAEKE